MIESTMSSKLEKVENNSKSSQLQDTTSLHDQLQRALSELKAYQVKYPPIFTNDPQPIDGNGPVWETASDVMSPLLRSYDASKWSIFSF